MAASLKPGEVGMLENVRFHKEEEKNDPAFAKELASMAEVYVNDAFGTAHRAHASTAGVADYLPAVCGYLVQKEVSIMGKALADPERPFVAILGGAKVSDKLNVINNLLEKVDTLIIGGGMAYTFIKAQGGEIGVLDATIKLDYCRGHAQKAKKGVRFLLPIDNLAADHFAGRDRGHSLSAPHFPENLDGARHRPEDHRALSGRDQDATTVVWNGPMGVFEFDAFAGGTRRRCGGARRLQRNFHYRRRRLRGGR